MNAVALHLSPTPDDVDISEALTGLKALGQTPTPQQLDVARVLCAQGVTGAPLYDEVGICIPRRSGKSSAIWAVIIGRCMARDNYMVVVTAASGVALAKYAKGIAATLDKHCPDDTRRFYKGMGQIHFEWTNGSQLWIVPPRENSYRGDAADCLVFDEAQSHDPESSDDLVAAAEPLMDTRDGQLIVAGTAGAQRAGMLWGQLEVGRADPSTKGIVEYAAEPGSDSEDDAVLAAVHPGISSGLTTMAKIVARRAKMSVHAFAREYLGLWPEDGSTKAIDPDAWARAARDEFADRPAAFTLAFEVAIDGLNSAVVAAWRVDGVAHVEVLAHRPGSDWVTKFVYDLVKKYRVKCYYDQVPSNTEVAQRLAREAVTRTRVLPNGAKDTAAAQARMERDVRDGVLVHADQPSLNVSVECAVWRPGGRGGRYFGRRVPSDDISPLVAASGALWGVDQQKEVQPLFSIVQTG